MADPQHANPTPQPLTPAPYWGGSSASRGGASKKDLLKKYRTCLATSKKWRKNEGYDNTWKRLNDLYRNKHYPNGLQTEDRIAINISKATIDVIVPSVAVNHPNITITPRRPIDEENAPTTEAAINYYWRQQNWRKEMKRVVKDSLIFGHGWAKIGWTYREKPTPLGEDQRAQMLGEQIQQAGDYAEQNPQLAAELPTDEEIAQGIPTEEMQSVMDVPFVERVSVYDVLVDPEATCYEDLKWIAQKIVVPLEDAKKDKRYSAAARKALKADAGTNPRWRDENEKNKYSDDVKRCTLWEFYELEKEYYCVLDEGDGEHFLLEPTDYPNVLGNPFRMLPNYEVPDYFYPLGELEALEPIQHELNAVRSDMMNHRKRWQRAYVYDPDRFDEDGMTQLTSNVDNRMIPLIGDGPIDAAIMPVQQIPLAPEMYNYSDVIEQDAELVTGVSEYQRGAAPETRRTATEASIIQDAANARSADKLSEVELYMGQVARAVVQLLQTHLTTEEVARIVDEQGAATWVPFDRETVQGEFAYEVEAGSTQPKNETFRRQQAQTVSAAMMPFVEMQVVKPDALAAYLLREGFGIKNIEEFLYSPEEQMMMQQQAMMAEQQQMEAEQAAKGGGEQKPPEEEEMPQGPEGPIAQAQLQQLMGQVGLNLPTMPVGG